MRASHILLALAFLAASPAGALVHAVASSDEQQPRNGGDGFDFATTVPAFPVARADNKTACRLDLSDELFGGVDDACVRGGLDRNRCCPVLAAWLFAAHARSALELRQPLQAESGIPGADGPVVPDDSQKCVDSLHSALERRDIRLPRPNATCDTVLCFCGIRLHQIGSLQCPAAFNVSSAASSSSRYVTPSAAVRQLEHDCRNASYAGCTRCLRSLDKVKGGGAGDGSNGGSGDRAARMFGRDCQLMGLTWLLAKNKTAYIPAVSAVLRAVLYGSHPVLASNGSGNSYKCSPDKANMPLAVDSLQLQHHSSSASASYSFALLLLLLLHLTLPLL